MIKQSWHVSGDHPILRRPDKTFFLHQYARAYAALLKNAGYENIKIEHRG